MPGVDSPKDGTRGAGGIVDSRFANRLLGGLHVPLYRLTGGLIGHRTGKVTYLLLTTTGAKSGLPRTLGLTYGRDGDNLILVASKGGSQKHPLWYRNLVANPDCEAQVGSRRVRCRARTATPKERPRLWALMTGIYAGYDTYRKSTDREIPIVVLEPIKP